MSVTDEPKPEIKPDPDTLEIGCGDIPDPHYLVHLDARPLAGVDIVGKWQEINFPEASFHKIFSNQTLEHLYKNEQEEAFRKSLRWLKPNGVLEVWTPCLDRLAVLATEGSISWPWFQMVVYGEQSYPENCHRWCHTLNSLQELAVSTGFEVDVCEEVEGSIRLLARRPK